MRDREQIPTTDSTRDAVRLESVTKRYGTRGAERTALDSVDARFAPGTCTAVMGPSGSGKSTLLHCAAGLDRPTSGAVVVNGVAVHDANDRTLSRLRREDIGFVFQSFNLLPELTVGENVALPLRLAGRRPRRAEIAAVLDRVGLADRRRARPGQLSGGQQQRVAIARALLGRPRVLFADEPTGALDSGTARDVLTLLRAAVAGGATLVLVTHDPIAASSADRVLFLADGRIAGELYDPTPDTVADRMTRLTAPRRDPGARELASAR